MENYMENYIILLQRRFRINKIKKAIKELSFDKKVVENNSFDEFIDLIVDEKILFLTTLILTNITQLSNYGEKNVLIVPSFLSAFVIYGYPEDIMVDDASIIKISKQVVETFDSLLYTKLNIFKIQKFNKLLIEYKEIFDVWKLKDNKQFLHTLTTSYYEVESIIQKADNNIEQIKILRERQEDIINKIIYVNGQEYFNNYKPEEITLCERHIKDILHDAFWDIFKTELDSTPPVYDKLFQILEEVKETFCKFIPNRKDIQEEICENIDINLIKNMIENGAFDDENLYKLSTYIISLIKRFQPPIMDNDIDNWEEGMLEQFKENFEYSGFLIIFFKSVFNMLENIIFYAKKIIDENKNDFPIQMSTSI